MTEQQEKQIEAAPASMIGGLRSNYWKPKTYKKGLQQWLTSNLDKSSNPLQKHSTTEEYSCAMLVAIKK